MQNRSCTLSEQKHFSGLDRKQWSGLPLAEARPITCFTRLSVGGTSLHYTVDAHAACCTLCNPHATMYVLACRISNPQNVTSIDISSLALQYFLSSGSLRAATSMSAWRAFQGLCLFTSVGAGADGAAHSSQLRLAYA